VKLPSLRHRYARLARLKIAAIAVLACAAPAKTSADSVRLAPRPAVVELGELSAALTSTQLTEIALAFSDVPAESRPRYHAIIDELLSLADRTIAQSGGDYATGEEILQFLHSELLESYDESQTYFDVLLDSGRHNCVSSSILYLIVARHFELEIQGTVTSDHAFCTLRIDDELVDIETTTSYGFDPGKKTEFQDEFGNTTGYSYVPATNYRDRNSVDARGLLALILHNRISLYDSQGRYGDALAASIDRHAFISDESTFDDVLREIGNYLAVLNSDRRYEEALAVLADVYSRYGVRSELERSHYGILNNLLVALLEAGEFESARSIFRSQLASEVFPLERVSELEIMLVRRELAVRLPHLSTGEGFDLVRMMRAQSTVPDEAYREFEISLYGRSAEEAAAGGEYLRAAEIVERGMAQLGRDSRLQRASDVYRYNFAAAEHNRFAEHFNAGKIDLAREIVLSALELVPESRLLEQDLATVDRVLKSSGN